MIYGNDHKHIKKKKLDRRNGKETKKDFKEYLIDEISKLFEVYSPEQSIIKSYLEFIS
jgi:hypothetical protein